MPEKTCQLTGKTYEISDVEARLCAENELPLPVLCPDERFRRIASFRNEKQMFLRTCDATGVKMFSVFTPEMPFPVYTPEYWRSDKWDPLSFGQPFDFKRLFVEQLLELWRRVPRPAYISFGAAKCRIVHRLHESVSCFLLFDSRGSSECLYGSGLDDCRRCVDCYQLRDCSSCYETVLSESSERLRFGQWCLRCKDSWFLSNCEDCEECLFCVNLKGKRRHVFNKPVGDEEYQRVLNELTQAARPLLDDARNRFSDFLSEQISPIVFARNTEDSTGNYLSGCTDAAHCFEVFEGHELGNCHSSRNAVCCYDTVASLDVENVLQCVGIVGGRNLLNCVECTNLSNSRYSAYCEDSSDLFGCVGLRNKRHCIFNTQFTKVEYEELIERVVKHLKTRNVYGTPLPLSFAEHTYNHSMANEHMPLTKVPSKMMGFNWDETDRVLRPSELIGESETSPDQLYAELPETLEGVEDDAIAAQVFLCTHSGKPYQLVRDELQFYREMNVPPPAVCFQQRHIERLARITPHALNRRLCSTCGASVQSAVPPKWKQPLACVDCFSEKIG